MWKHFFFGHCGKELFSAGCTKKKNVRQNICDRPRLSISHEFGFGPKRTLFLSTSPSALIFSPILAFAHLLSVSSGCARRKRPERATTSSPEIPTASRTNPSNSQPFALAPGHSVRKFVKKAAIFRLFL